MVLNHDQRVYSKIVIEDLFKITLIDPDKVKRAMEILNELYDEFPIRTEIYIELKKALEREFDIHPTIFYGVILKQIDTLFTTGLDFLDVFQPTDVEIPRKKK